MRRANFMQELAGLTISGGPQRTSCPLRVAIIGAGLMGYWHGRTARYLEAQVVAILDPDAKRANFLARKLRVGAVAEDPSDILRQGLDAVHICSPLSTHAALARKAMEAGVHALVEKPLTETAEDSRTLFDIAQRNSTILCPVHQMAFQDCMTAAQGAIAELGEIALIDIRICTAGGIGRPERNLDELISEILPHPLSILRKLWPHANWEPQQWFVSHPRPGEILVSGEHAGALLSVLVSMHARPTCFEMVLRGHRGSILLDFFHGFAVRYHGTASRLNKIARPLTSSITVFGIASVNLLSRGWRGEVAYPGLRNLVQAFYAAVRGESPMPIPIEDVIAVAIARDIISQRAADAYRH
jgi:predicted dehydrogenase